jgi:multicomponent Na+:H+ antiporter subunit C
LILTAIVVSESTMAVALALVIAIKRAYGTVEADELTAKDRE